MQLLLDFLPILAFFITYKVTGNNIFAATAVTIVAVIVQTSVQWLRHRKVSTMSLISAGTVLIFGGLTLIVHDKTFIQWKVTVLYWLFAIVFFASHYLGAKPMVERMLGELFAMERRQWLRLSWVWIAFFTILGIVNLYVAYNYSESTWVNFKVFYAFGLLAAFFAANFYWLWPKLRPDLAD
jgi:intracellular septation protein